MDDDADGVIGAEDLQRALEQVRFELRLSTPAFLLHVRLLPHPPFNPPLRTYPPTHLYRSSKPHPTSPHVPQTPPPPHQVGAAVDSSELTQLLSASDLDGMGRIDYEEFLAAMMDSDR